MKHTIKGFRFGPFQLDLAGYVLTHNGHRVRVSGSQMELLSLFVSRPGELIAREQIVAALWKEPQSVDVRQGINTAVTRLRAVLGDDPAAPRYIETVIGKGYRFITEVEEFGEDAAELDEPDRTVSAQFEDPVVLDSRLSIPEERQRKISVLDEELSPNSSNPDREAPALAFLAGSGNAASLAGDAPKRSGDAPTRSARLVWGVGAVVFGCLAAAVLLWRQDRPWSAAGVGSQAAGLVSHKSQVGSTIHSLAVIPLANLSDGKEQQYFADGLTDALISSLAAGTQLRVTSRASSMHFRGVDRPSREMARELGVDALVEGSVLRMGGRMHITAHLVDARLDRDLWSQSFDTAFSSSLAVVDTISKGVSQRLAQPVESVRRSGTPMAEVNSQAYDDYLRGRYLWRKRDLPSMGKAIEYFKRAVAEQPDFALPHAGLADAYLASRSVGLLPVDEANRLARGEAEEAIRLDPELAEARTSMAYVHEVSYEWSDAETEYRRAIAIDPSYAPARQWYSNYLSLRGRHGEAIEQARLGVAADPLSPSIQTQLGVAFYYARRYDEAIAAFKKTLEMEPRFIVALGRLGVSYAQKGMYAEALATLRSTPETEKACIEYLAYVEGRAGQTTEAATLIRRLEEGAPDPMGLMYATLPLGDKTMSFELMRHAIAIRQSGNFAVEPLFDSLRSDPRYREMVNQLHMP